MQIDLNVLCGNILFKFRNGIISSLTLNIEISVSWNQNKSGNVCACLFETIYWSYQGRHVAIWRDWHASVEAITLAERVHEVFPGSEHASFYHWILTPTGDGGARTCVTLLARILAFRTAWLAGWLVACFHAWLPGVPYHRLQAVLELPAHSHHLQLAHAPSQHTNHAFPISGDFVLYM